MDDATAILAEEIFGAALELPAHERPHFLRARCGENAPLREAVTELLAAHEEAGPAAFLAAPIGSDQLAAALRATDGGDSDGPPVLERYRVLERIGEGGMGVVWRAKQIAGVNRLVAIKVMKGGFASAEALNRFELERHALARMNHPHIARILDAGTTRHGRPYFVMELVAGRPLVEFCDEHQLPVSERLQLFRLVCEAVQHAHLKGIIHRDLKPSNILVDTQEGTATPKVIDFGLAKTLGEHFATSTFHTVAGMMFGSPAYISPEQASPGSSDIDTRTDVFSLGVILYELLTGTTPVPREELSRLSLEAAFAAVARNDAMKPSARLARLATRLEFIATQRATEPSVLISTVQGDLDWITLKALERGRGRRYQTATELGADIDRYLTHQPVVARPPSAPYRLRKFARRHRLATGLAAGLLGASVFGAGISLSLMLRAKQSESELAAFVNFLTDDVLASARPSGQPGGLGVETTVRDALESARTRITERFGGRPHAEALTRHALGVTFEHLGEPRQAIAELERALELRRATLGDTDPRTLSTLSHLGQAYHTGGQLDDALSSLNQALQAQETLLGPGHVDTVNTMIMLGKAYSRADRAPDLARAIDVCEQALERSTRLFGPDSPKSAACQVHLGGAYFLAGRYAEAITLHEAALQAFRTTYSASHPYTLSVMSDLALDYMAARNVRPAIELQRELGFHFRRQLGAEHPTYLATLASLAYACLVEGDFAPAEAAARECLAVRTRTLGENHPDTITITVTLLQSLLGQNRYEAAVPLARKVVVQRERTMPRQWRLPLSQLLLGESLLGAGQHAQATPVLEESFMRLKAARADIPVWSAGVSASLERIGRLIATASSPNDTSPWAERTVEWQEWERRRRAELNRGTIVQSDTRRAAR